MSVHPMTMEEIFAKAESGEENFTPDSLVAARKYVPHSSSSLA